MPAHKITPYPLKNLLDWLRKRQEDAIYVSCTLFLRILSKTEHMKARADETDTERASPALYEHRPLRGAAHLGRADHHGTL